MKRAVLYRRAGAFLVHASSRTTDGLWVLQPPCLQLSESASDEELGAMVRAALEGSRNGIPTPAIGPILFAPMLELSGAKSWSAFAKTARCAELEGDVGEIAVVPCERAPNQAFSKVETRTIKVRSAAPAELARACRAALA